jgi:PAS domain S-box-containing protein
MTILKNPRRKPASGERGGAPAVDGPDYEALIQAAGDIIYTLDLQGRFTSVNPAAERVLGYTPREVLGRPFTDFLTPDSAQVALRHFGQGLSGIENSPFFEVDAVGKLGQQVHLEIRAGGLFCDGVMTGRQGIGRDISQLRRLQSEVAAKSERVALLEERTRIAMSLYARIAGLAREDAAEGADSGSALQQVHEAVLRVSAEKIGLTPTDLKILDLISKGGSNREIAIAVCLSPHTIKDHIRKIMQRLGANRRAELVARALQLGLIQAEQ